MKRLPAPSAAGRLFNICSALSWLYNHANLKEKASIYVKFDLKQYRKSIFKYFIKLNYLPFVVPATPEIQLSDCQVCDNTITVVWTLPEPDGKIDHYILEHRRTNHEGPPRIREDYPWMVVEGIRETEHTLTGGRRTRGGIQQHNAAWLMSRFCVQGLRFDTRYMTFRVKACNKAVAGEFSEPVTLETHGENH